MKNRLFIVLTLFLSLISCADFLRINSITPFIKKKSIGVVWYELESTPFDTRTYTRNLKTETIIVNELKYRGYNAIGSLKANDYFKSYSGTVGNTLKNNKNTIEEINKNNDVDVFLINWGGCAASNYGDSCFIISSFINRGSSSHIAEDIINEQRRFRGTDKPTIINETSTIYGTTKTLKTPIEYTESFSETRARLFKKYFDKF